MALARAPAGAQGPSSSSSSSQPRTTRRFRLFERARLAFQQAGRPRTVEDEDAGPNRTDVSTETRERPRAAARPGVSTGTRAPAPARGARTPARPGVSTGTRAPAPARGARTPARPGVSTGTREPAPAAPDAGASARPGVSTGTRAPGPTRGVPVDAERPDESPNSPRPSLDELVDLGENDEIEPNAALIVNATDSPIATLRPQFPVPTAGAAVQEVREAIPREQESRILERALKIPDESRFRLFGWIENSFTGNPALSSGGLNFGVNPNDLANQWMGNQYYLVVARAIEQSDVVNFGFRFDALFGNGWQFNHMEGMLNNEFKLNSFVGFDPAQFYADVHLPVLTPFGLDIRAGRWYTIAGFAGVPAVSRPLLSVPYMFNYGQPFTHFGMLSTLHLTRHIDVFNGAINGWDRWLDTNYRWGYIGGVSYTSEGAREHFALTGIWGPNQFPSFLQTNTQIFPPGYVNIPSLAGLPNPGYARNDRTLLTWVYSHQWTKKLVQTIETDQGWERSIPGLASGGRNYAPESDFWISFGNWFIYNANDWLTGVWRSEIFRDVHGSRTGYPGTFYEMTLGLIITPRPGILIRPEVRWDWSQFSHPFDNGTSYHQFTIGTDVIFRF